MPGALAIWQTSVAYFFSACRMRHVEARLGCQVGGAQAFGHGIFPVGMHLQQMALGTTCINKIKPIAWLEAFQPGVPNADAGIGARHRRLTV